MRRRPHLLRMRTARMTHPHGLSGRSLLRATGSHRPHAWPHVRMLPLLLHVRRRRRTLLLRAIGSVGPMRRVTMRRHLVLLRVGWVSVRGSWRGTTGMALHPGIHVGRVAGRHSRMLLLRRHRLAWMGRTLHLWMRRRMLSMGSARVRRRTSSVRRSSGRSRGSGHWSAGRWWSRRRRRRAGSPACWRSRRCRSRRGRY